MKFGWLFGWFSRQKDYPLLNFTNSGGRPICLTKRAQKTKVIDPAGILTWEHSLMNGCSDHVAAGRGLVGMTGLLNKR